MRKILTVIALLSIGFGVSEFVHLYNSSFQTTARKEEILKESTTSSVLSETPSSLEIVKRVIDGDTIELATGKRVRYIGIDTPETVDPRKPVQCFGREAKEENMRLVDGKTVRLEKDISETDRYGRLLRYIYVDNVMVNETLVKNGFAHTSSFPPDIKYQDRFLSAEKEARENNRGLWSGCVTSTPLTIQQYNNATIAPVVDKGNENTCSIKGNISTNGERIYHLPGCGSYDKTVIDESTGEHWFCAEEEAQKAGWRKAKNC